MLVEKKMRWPLGGIFELPTWFITLSNEISNFLDEIPLAVLKRVVFHQDGAIPLNARMNLVFLNHFGERRMGAHGAIRWAARSPDLNPLDFFIFIRNFRDNVYLTPSGTMAAKKFWPSLS
jgi:hypothetical protein